MKEVTQENCTIPDRYDRRLLELIKKCLATKPVERPVLAEMILDPLFREFITLKPFNERLSKENETEPSCGKYADHDGFLIGENTFAGRRTWEKGQVNLAILEDMKYMVG